MLGSPVKLTVEEYPLIARHRADEQVLSPGTEAWCIDYCSARTAVAVQNSQSHTPGGKSLAVGIGSVYRIENEGIALVIAEVVEIDLFGDDIAIRIKSAQSSDDGIRDRKVRLSENGAVLLKGAVNQSLIAACGLSALADGAADSEEGLLIFRADLESIAGAVGFLRDNDSGDSLIIFGKGCFLHAGLLELIRRLWYFFTDADVAIVHQKKRCLQGIAEEQEVQS